MWIEKYTKCAGSLGFSSLGGVHRARGNGYGAVFRTNRRKPSRRFLQNLASLPGQSRFGQKLCKYSSERSSRVCQYTKGFLIKLSSLKNVGTSILKHLPFFFFQISFIFRFFLNPHLAPNLYIVVQLVLHLDYWWQGKESKHIGSFILYTIKN